MGRGIHEVIHPVMTVERDATGSLREVLGEASADRGERECRRGHPRIVDRSRSHRESDAPDREDRHPAASRSLHVREAVEDWSKMRERAREVAENLRANPAGRRAGRGSDASRRPARVARR